MSRSSRETYRGPVAIQDGAVHSRLSIVADGAQYLVRTAHEVDPGIGDVRRESANRGEPLDIWSTAAEQTSPVTAARLAEVQNMGADLARNRVAQAHATGPDAAPVAERPLAPVINMQDYLAGRVPPAAGPDVAPAVTPQPPAEPKVVDMATYQAQLKVQAAFGFGPEQGREPPSAISA